MYYHRYSFVLYFLFCVVMIGYFFALLLFPPIVTAVAYTVVSIIMYRANYKIFTYVNFLGTDYKYFAFAILCAVLWPLKYLLGAFFFLGKAITR